MHKLTTMEAQRVIAVMEGALDKLSTLSYIPSQAKQDLLNSINDYGAQPVKRCLQTQWHLEQSAAKSGAFGESKLLSKTNNTDMNTGNNNGNSEMRNGDMLEQIYQNTRTLCRSLRQYPHAMEVLHAYSQHDSRSPAVLTFNQLISELTSIVFRKLSTTVEEEGTTKKLLLELTERKRLAEDERDTLQQTLNVTRTEKEREISVMESTIKRLRMELQDLTGTYSTLTEGMRAKSDDAIARATADHNRTTNSLKDIVERLEKEVLAMRTAHKEEEMAAHKKKIKAEGELAAVVAKYDEAMINTSDNMARVRALMQQESKELAELTEHFDRIDANATRVALEEESLARVKQRVITAQRVIDTAVAKIQAVYRGKTVRAELARTKKKGKGKKAKKAKS